MMISRMFSRSVSQLRGGRPLLTGSIHTGAPNSARSVTHCGSASALCETQNEISRFMCDTIDLDIFTGNVEDTFVQKSELLDRESPEHPFYVINLTEIVNRHQLWYEELPNVTPFFAVKCNNDPAILATLAHLGTGFDCASKVEIGQVLSMGVSPDRIVYANPAKSPDHLMFAARKDVRLQTFDSVEELHKIKAMYPDAELLIRLQTTKADHGFDLSKKFGCILDDVPEILHVAKTLDLNVIGACIHVGSDTFNPTLHAESIVNCRKAFDIAHEIGFMFNLLDIGGGFPGAEYRNHLFREMAANLRTSLDHYFPTSSGVRLISEPGTFFPFSAISVVANIIGRRRQPGQKDAYDYYMNDGVYGSFSASKLGVPVEQPFPLRPRTNSKVSKGNRLWGQTCCSEDLVIKDLTIEDLQVGDWLAFPGMGAYTNSLVTGFNGMSKPHAYYSMHQDTWETFANMENHNLHQ